MALPEYRLMKKTIALIEPTIIPGDIVARIGNRMIAILAQTHKVQNR